MWVGIVIARGTAVPRADREIVTNSPLRIPREAVKFILARSLESMESAISFRYDATHIQNTEPITDVIRVEAERRIAVVFRGVLGKYRQDGSIDPYRDAIRGPIIVRAAVVRFEVVKNFVDVEKVGRAGLFSAPPSPGDLRRCGGGASGASFRLSNHRRWRRPKGTVRVHAAEFLEKAEELKELKGEKTQGAIRDLAGSLSNVFFLYRHKYTG